MLEAARKAFPPSVVLAFVQALVALCSCATPNDQPISLECALLKTGSVRCPGVTDLAKVAFRRLAWPRQTTMAQLERYRGVLLPRTTSLRRMDSSEWLLDEHYFAQGWRCRACCLGTLQV